MRVAIVGGGINGCLTAMFLKQRGAEPVILERGR
ncbi:MAG: FAD-dependent oxidoreductase, partial [Mariprofundaceae bacterium]|nr:FAD-dependent oxidoreductase [Mariprofundaceae bacterium]